MIRRPLIALGAAALLGACSDSGTLAEYPVPELTLELTSPTYGAFTGRDRVRVTGVVSHPETVVRVDGVPAPVREDGTFDVWMPIDGVYRIVDVQAVLRDQVAEARVPVFAGDDPLESWPGGVALQFTPYGIGSLELVLEGAFDQLLSPDLVSDVLPPFGQDGFTIEVSELRRDPIDVTIVPTDEGLETTIVLEDLEIDILATVDLLGFPVEVPATLGLPRTEIGTRIGLESGDEGLVLAIDEPASSFEPPTVELFSLGFDWLGDILLDNLDIEDLIDQALGGLGDIPLGDLGDFETDLLGTSLSVSVAEVRTNADGLGVALGLGIDEPAPTGGSPVPWPSVDGEPPSDLTVTVHDGLLSFLLESDLLDLLEQDIELPGFLGGFIGNLVSTLPGGSQVPDDNGWCVSLNPGDAKVARFGQSPDPLLGLYFPDASLTFGYVPADGPAGVCEDWLVSALALEVGLDLGEELSLGLDIAVPEGKVLYYGAGDFDEEEIIGRLGGLIENLLDLLGGLGGLDLDSLLGGGDLLGGLDLGGALGLEGLELSLGITRATTFTDEDGGPTGMAELGVRLFAPEDTTVDAP